MELDDLLEAWRANNAINLELLGLCSDETLEFKPGKGKTIRSNFSHIIMFRGAWIEAKFPKASTVRVDWKTASREEIKRALIESSEQMEDLFRRRIEKPDKYKPLTFFAYAIAHEAHHRSQIEIALRLNGAEPPDAVLYRLWEWSKK